MQQGLISLIVFSCELGQEMKFHGINMAGPAHALEQAGAKGKYPGNVQRDVLRQIGKLATR